MLVPAAKKVLPLRFVHVAPPSVLSTPVMPPPITWLAFVGSTAIVLSYHPWLAVPLP